MTNDMAAPAGGAYSELQAGLIIGTVERLEQRIAERFPGSGLSRVAGELARIGGETERVVARLRRPIWTIRIATFAGVVALIMFALMLASLFVSVPPAASPGAESLSELLQGVEAGVNEVVFLSLAVFFLVSLEARVKRRRVIRALHRLRSIAHIVDMHQLTKDPQFVLGGGKDTASSPRRTLTRFELARYLDYCSELLSLSSKLAALHVQYVNDPVVLDAVNDIETLAASLSNKIWQKIMILDTVDEEPDARRG
ncbi:hypothetical protein [Longimicrobium sp.]|uniref:hypothetical protein n=1 Tax=Longimicrobium sp. TaxID=2029185 RepID=UPI002B95F622|nr:hypothetical protein [Longimicrobium sp.]HSU17932.1 hypothetical protein [Longimicrobium sp.]